MDFRISPHQGIADQGRKEIEIARKAMPGLQALREKYAAEKPLKGARIAGSLHVTVETAVLVETLVALGAEVRWSSCNALSTYDPAAHALKEAGIPIFAWKGETPDEYLWCLKKTLEFKEGPNLIIDDGADLTLLIHESYPTLLPGIKGVSEETTTGIRRLKQLEAQKGLKTAVYNVSDAVTKKAFDNYYGSKESFIDGLKQALNPMIAGKVAVVAGFGEVGRGCAMALKNYGAQVLVTEADPIRAYQAVMEGFRVVTMETAAPLAELFVTATGCDAVITEKHFKVMKDQAILCNMGHFDVEIDMAWLNAHFKKEPVKPGIDLYKNGGKSLLVLGEGRLLNLACANGHPPLVMSNSFSCQLLAQLALFKALHSPGIYPFPASLDQEVARLHLKPLGAELTYLSNSQKDYLSL